MILKICEKRKKSLNSDIDFLIGWIIFGLENKDADFVLISQKIYKNIRVIITLCFLWKALYLI